jgi:hypothetical protein
MKKRIAIVALLCVCVGSAAIIFLLLHKTPVITRTDLNELLIRTQGNTFPSAMHYEGSDESYDHYFLTSYNANYRVIRERNRQENRMPFTADKAHWQYVDGSGPSPTGDWPTRNQLGHH